MDTLILIEKLEQAGYVGVIDLHIELCRVDTDAYGDPFYPRDHQLSIMRSYLSGCEEYEPNNIMVPYLKQWISKFESLSIDTPVYFWHGKYNGKSLHGRSTDDEVIQIFPQD